MTKTTALVTTCCCGDLPTAQQGMLSHLRVEVIDFVYGLLHSACLYCLPDLHAVSDLL